MLLGQHSLNDVDGEVLAVRGELPHPQYVSDKFEKGYLDMISCSFSLMVPPPPAMSKR